MHDHHSTTSAIAAIVVIAVLAGVCACVVVGCRRRGWRRVLLIGAGAGGLFQVGHFTEHAAQAGYWTAHRSEAPWMTPWATALADSFGALAPDTPGFGMEAMHLVGNAIFLAGAVGIFIAIARSAATGTSHRLARSAVWVQSAHVVEHVALTTSVVLSGEALGLSTLFGALDPGPGLWTYRVWWHFTINAVATSLLLVAVARQARGLEASSAVTRTPALAR